MNSYKITSSILSQLPFGMIGVLEKSLAKFGIDFYLIGAVARDVWMNGIHQIGARRITRDIDFAILINDKGVYEQLREHLINNEDFKPSKENAFVLTWNGTEIDLMPFGAIEDDNARVSVEGTGFTTVDVPGFQKFMNKDWQHLNWTMENVLSFVRCLQLSF